MTQKVIKQGCLEECYNYDNIKAFHLFYVYFI